MVSELRNHGKCQNKDILTQLLLGDGLTRSAAPAPGRKQRGNRWKWTQKNGRIRNILGAPNPTECVTGNLALCTFALALLVTAQKGDFTLHCVSNMIPLRAEELPAGRLKLFTCPPLHLPYNILKTD